MNVVMNFVVCVYQCEVLGVAVLVYGLLLAAIELGVVRGLPGLFAGFCNLSVVG